MVKFYRTALPLVKEGYRYDARTLYYHKLIATERRKDNWILKRRAYRLWLWKREFRKEKQHLWSDETRRLAKLYKPTYQKYKWQLEAEEPLDKQLQKQASIRALSSRFYFLQNVKGQELGKKELVATLQTAGSVVKSLDHRMLHSTARNEKRQALGFLERRVVDKLLDQVDELTINDCASILRAMAQLSANEQVFGRVLDTLYPRITLLLTEDETAKGPAPITGQLVWMLYVLASCRQLREPTVEVLKGLMDRLTSAIPRLHAHYAWRVAQALSLVADVYLPSPEAVRSLHAHIDEAMHKHRPAKLAMLLWVVVRHRGVVAPEPELLARLQDTMIEGLHRTGDARSLVEALFVLADVAPHVELRRGIASHVAMQLHGRLGIIARGQYRTVVKSLAGLMDHMLLPEGYLLALGRQPRLRKWELDEGEKAALEKLGALMVDEPGYKATLGVPDLTDNPETAGGGASLSQT